MLAFAGLALAGCGPKRPLTLIEVDQPMTFAVAPALNHSGSGDFDPIRVADLMASELTLFPGTKVVPVNRVLAQLESEGKERIESPAHALQIKERLGVDSILVFAVTEYDAYAPLTLGVSAQLYGRPRSGATGFDPVAESKRASSQYAGYLPQLPAAEFQWVFRASDERVVRRIKRFSLLRNGDDHPMGWRKYLASQENFLRFCFHETIDELIRQEVTHVLARQERKDEVEQP